VLLTKFIIPDWIVHEILILDESFGT